MTWPWSRPPLDPHAPCTERRLELLSTMRSQIEDLQEQVRSLYETIAQKDEASALRERDLLDRLIAMVNPMAIRVMQGPGSGAQAPTMAQPQPSVADAASRPAPAFDPARVSYPTTKPRRAPTLTPQDSRFRPLIKHEAEKLQRAQEQIDKMVRDANPSPDPEPVSIETTA